MLTGGQKAPIGMHGIKHTVPDCSWQRLHHDSELFFRTWCRDSKLLSGKGSKLSVTLIALIFYTHAGYIDGSCRSLRSLCYIAPYFYFVRYDLLLRHSALHLTCAFVLKSRQRRHLLDWWVDKGYRTDRDPFAIWRHRNHVRTCLPTRVSCCTPYIGEFSSSSSQGGFYGRWGMGTLRRIPEHYKN